MRRHYTLKDWVEMIFLLMLVIPVWIGLSDAFSYTVFGNTWTGFDWTWGRVLLVLMFFILKVFLTIARKQRILREIR
jgi:hypothetical protein